jgi:polyisoprenoid-binding protein YceI
MKIFFIIFAAIFSIFSLELRAETKTYKIDPNHANITWKANHFGFSSPSGKFSKVEGEIELDEKNPDKSSVHVEIDASSVITGVAKFDQHLKTKDFFNVAQYLMIMFKSDQVVPTGNQSAKIFGTLTLLGVSKQVILDVALNKIGEHPFNSQIARMVGFSATTTIKRSDFGMNFALPGISDEVKIEIEIEAILDK